jgi:putative SOS response-associated peptidase YedK
MFIGVWLVARPSGPAHNTPITPTTPNELVGQYHNRMPAILKPDQRRIWLDKNVNTPEVLLPLLKPFSSEELEVYEVSKQVNSPKFNTPDCIKPIEKNE